MLLFTIRDGLLVIVKIDGLSCLLSIVLFIYLEYLEYNVDASTLVYINNAQTQTLPVSFSISLAILTAFTYILSPWYGQKYLPQNLRK